MGFFEKKEKERLVTQPDEIGALIADIEQMLVSHGATSIMKQYNDGILSGILFSIPAKNPGSYATFKLPVFPDHALLKKDGKSDGNAVSDIWLTVRNYIAACMDMTDRKISSIEEIFLPYIVCDKNDRTAADLFFSSAATLNKHSKEEMSEDIHEAAGFTESSVSPEPGHDDDRDYTVDGYYRADDYTILMGNQ